MQYKKELNETRIDDALENVSGGKRPYDYDKNNPRGGKPHTNIGTIGNVDHSKTTLTADITTKLRKEALDDQLLNRATGGEGENWSSEFYIQCVETISNGNAYEAWSIYHSHFNEINPIDRDFLRQMYQDAFHRSIDDDVASIDLD